MKISSLSMRALRALSLVCIVGLSLFAHVSANNIRIIGKPILDKQDTTKKTILIKFDIAWDNSWRTTKPDNHDAAWIFVKCWDGEAWNHVYLDKDGTVAGSTTAADAVNKGTAYYVSDREGKNTKQKMVLEPGYSYAWKQWHVDPDEDSVQCIVGYFLYRETYGAGHVVVPGVTFKWNYGTQGFVDGDDLVVKVFAIEMVYVPQGAYYLGGKGTAAWQVGSFTTNGATFGTPMVVTSEDAITVANETSASTLWAANNYIVAGKIPDSFPKGYQAFYIMKYEMTQEAYCEFLNTLNQGQQDGRIEGTLAALAVNNWAWGGDLAPYRNYIKVQQAAPVAIFGCDANNNQKYNETDEICYDKGSDTTGKCFGRTLTRNIDGQDLAVNFVSMYDLLAYAEFSGLRPMTELEYEKACRGPREPVNNEYAWGSVTKVLFAYTFHSTAGAWYNFRNQAGVFLDPNTGTERTGDSYNSGVSHGYTQWGVNWWTWGYTYYPAPLRVGIFADSTSTRAASGATYWGVMNMSDNVAEMCISAYNAVGRAFEGVHGCGQVDGNGNAINVGWHISSAANYYITKGMAFYYWTSSNRPSDRTNVPEFWYGGTITDHEWFWAGMTSSRYRATHGIVGTNRNYTASGDVLRGIRCVRTDKASR